MNPGDKCLRDVFSCGDQYITDRKEKNRLFKMKALNDFYGKRCGYDNVNRYSKRYWDRKYPEFQAYADPKINYRNRYGDPRYISYGMRKRTEATRYDKMVNMNVVDKLYSIYGINRMDLMN